MTFLDTILVFWIAPSLTTILLLIWFIRYAYKPSYENRKWFYESDTAFKWFMVAAISGPVGLVGIIIIAILASDTTATIIKFLLKERSISWPQLKTSKPTIKDLHRSHHRSTRPSP